jgi:hypothetical protein
MTILLLRTNERCTKWHTEQVSIIEVTFIVWLIDTLHGTCWSNMRAVDLMLLAFSKELIKHLQRLTSGLTSARIM